MASRPASTAPPSPTPRHPPAGASTRGSSAASSSASVSAASRPSPPPASSPSPKSTPCPTAASPRSRTSRIVIGGSAVRAGAYVAPGVIVAPPAYINIGAHVGENTLVDSHALVGSCAQIGARVHLSAAAQIGGVLEPVNAAPVIIEDDALIGGNTGVYEGAIVRRRAVLAAGVILTRGTPVYDLVTGAIHRASPAGPDGPGTPLIIPENAVVVPGSRVITHGRGKDWNLSLATPIIVKYRDDKTELSLALEDLLR